MGVTCSLRTHFKGHSLTITTKPFKEQRKLLAQSVTLCEVSLGRELEGFYLRLNQLALAAFPFSVTLAAA